MNDSHRLTLPGVGFAALPLGAMLCAPGPAVAYERYSVNDDATYCGFCHGDFRSFVYVGRTDGESWGNLHDIHRYDILNEDCETCHLASDEFPVIIGESAGGDGLAPIGCVGCHGRAEDGTGVGTEGYGLAMQRRHEAANVGPDNNGDTCFDCHARAATTVPVGEDVLPPYYASPGNNHPAMPTDPCNPAGGENFAGAPAGIDNDADLLADQDDLDCSGAAPSPGEASARSLQPLLVTGRTAGSLTLQYDVPCEATDHRIHFGNLDQVSTYAYTGTECGILSSGSYTWATVPAAESIFFLVAADNGVSEGSYGTDSGGVERPANPVDSPCVLPRNLVERCD